jgi:hypothetical protein
MFSRDFWIAATERAAKTAAQVFLALAGAQAFNVLTADWQALVGVTAGAAVLSYATSLVSAQATKSGTPSLVPGAEGVTVEFVVEDK